MSQGGLHKFKCTACRFYFFIFPVSIAFRKCTRNSRDVSTSLPAFRSSTGGAWCLYVYRPSHGFNSGNKHNTFKWNAMKSGIYCKIRHLPNECPEIKHMYLVLYNSMLINGFIIIVQFILYLNYINSVLYFNCIKWNKTPSLGHITFVYLLQLKPSI